jgi:hypothetical protein
MRDNSGDALGRNQLDLFHVPVGDDAQWEKARRLTAETIDSIGTKEAAFEMDMAPSLLLHMLAERDRHRISGRVIVWAIAHAKDDDLLRFLAALRGRDVVAPEVLTPEEELVRLKQAVMKNFGPGGADLLRREVFGR